jgi:hypothetical protein
MSGATHRNLADTASSDVVYLRRIEKLLCIFEINLLAYKHIKQVGIDVTVFFELAQYL